MSRKYSPTTLARLDAAIRRCPYCDRRVLDWEHHQCVDQEAAA